MSVLLYDAHGEPLIERPDNSIEMPDDFDPSAPQPGVACRGCSCTDDEACLVMDAVRDRLGCFWVAPAICSSCRPDLAEAWTIYLASGAPS